MRIKEWFIRRDVVKMIVAALVLGFLLGMAVGVSQAADWTGRTKNYATQTIQFFYPNGSDVGVPECPVGWKYEAYVSMPDPENVPAFVPVLVLRGECPRAN